jgi:hypothetical protein
MQHSGNCICFCPQVGETFSVQCIRNSKLQFLDNLCQYNYIYIVNFPVNSHWQTLIKMMFWSLEKWQHWPTHTGWCLSFKSNHPLHVRRGIIQSLHNRAPTICQEWKYLINETDNLRCDLQLSGYPQGFTDTVINFKGSSSDTSKEENPLGS